MKKILLIATAALFAWTASAQDNNYRNTRDNNRKPKPYSPFCNVTAMRPRQAITAARRTITAAPWARA